MRGSVDKLGGETETTPGVLEPEQGYVGRRSPSVPKREAATGEEAQRLSCPEPRGLYPRHPSPGSGLCRRRTVTSPALPRGTASPGSGGWGLPWKGSLAARPGTRFQLQRLSEIDTDSRGRHDGLRAAPQRGQAPPPAPPPATPEPPARGPTGRRRRSSTRCRTFGFQPPCPRQPGSARPFKGSFPELKVSGEEAPASSALSLAFDNRSQSPLATIRLASERESRQVATLGAARRNAGICSPGTQGLLAVAPAALSYRELTPPPGSRWTPVSQRRLCSSSKIAEDSEPGKNYGLKCSRTGVGLLL
ncbi:uncharacterized protein LOC110565576 [Meriones unguiculatus]|uniref:uncharacterized protein LOC110565576 n=1 Tax=Meriones unguiculatus TaxID=10047 RepID=UPI00293E3BDC|nr:uncharacterized protein LOC110565576 [Meriones unguiculatus]